MKTEETNKLIAEFMGFVESPTTNKYWTKRSSEGFGIGELVDLKYNIDWNWLMEVVEKIENFGFEFFIVESRCRIANNTDKSIETIIDFEIIGTKIQATYKAVVEFIKWYNEQKSA
jgi:hypothetical protein